MENKYYSSLGNLVISLLRKLCIKEILLGILLRIIGNFLLYYIFHQSIMGNVLEWARAKLAYI